MSNRRQNRAAERASSAPRRLWRSLLADLLRAILGPDLWLRSAAIGFFSFLALVPGLTLLTSIYGMVVDPEDVISQLNGLQPLIPPAAHRLLESQLTDIVARPGSSLTIGLALSTLVSFWSANRATRALIISCNDAFHETERRGPLRLLLLSTLLTLAGLLYGAVALIMLVVVPALPHFFNTPGWVDALAGEARWPLLALVMVVWLTVFYKIAPAHRSKRPRRALWGALLATALWLLVSLGYSVVIVRFGRFNATYGALGGTAATMMWLYLSSATLLLGAELNARIVERSLAGPSP